MAQRPRRSICRPDYVAVADLKLPRNRKRSSHYNPTVESNDELDRICIIDEDVENSLAKVRYVGYGSDFDEWKARDDIVELSDSESDCDLREQPSSTIQRFCLFEELALRIKELLISSRKGNPVCRIVMSFDRMSFDSLVIRGTAVPKAGRSRRQVYTVSHMTKFDNLLGDRWYIRGLNAAGDFCFVTPGSVKLYLRETKRRIDYQLQSDGTMLKNYFGKGYCLVFSFIRSDGTSAQWNDVIRQCKA